MDLLVGKLKSLKGQEVTVYMAGVGPLAPVPTLPEGGPIYPVAGPLGITGMLHNVGMDYIELHVIMNTLRVVYIPVASIGALVPGCPLITVPEPGVVTTLPETI
jgi:hypothetical protein